MTLQDGKVYAVTVIKVSTAEIRDCGWGCPHLAINRHGRKKVRTCYLNAFDPVELLPPRKRKGDQDDENARQAAQRSSKCLKAATWVADNLRMQAINRMIGC
ncbi:MAG: hypothetical protein WC683_01840 [bacterium]